MPDRRQAVLDALRSAPGPMSILDLAREVGVHPNTVRFHLQVLTREGRVEQVEPVRTSPGRPPLMFRAHPGMDPTGRRSYQLLAEALVTTLGADEDAVPKAKAAGRSWGVRLAEAASGEPVTDEEATERLVGILDDLGFSPVRRTVAEESQIGLRNCPFLDLVPEHQRVVCPLHLGLMQGVMDGLDAGVGVPRLEPFVEPSLCLAHVG